MSVTLSGVPLIVSPWLFAHCVVKICLRLVYRREVGDYLDVGQTTGNYSAVMTQKGWLYPRGQLPMWGMLSVKRGPTQPELQMHREKWVSQFTWEIRQS